MVHTSLANVVGRTLEEDEVRISLLKVHWHKTGREATEFEQITRYADGTGGKLGRCTNARAGVAGRALGLRSAYVAVRERENSAEHIEELVEVWAFTRTEAEGRRSDRQAWMAVPIAEHDFPDARIVAMLYIDTSDISFFEPSTIDFIMGQSRAVAQLVRRCYG